MKGPTVMQDLIIPMLTILTQATLYWKNLEHPDESFNLEPSLCMMHVYANKAHMHEWMELNF